MRLSVKLFVGCVLLVGCSKSVGLERVIVSGKVTYQGQPVNQGSIRFVPVQGSKGPASAATIEHGTYEVKASGGVPIGTHRVEIQATRPTGEPKPDHLNYLDNVKEPVGQYLPPKYNTNSELTLNVETGRRMNYDFKLD